MANFTAGTSFSDGVTNDVTAAKLNALVADAVPTSNLSLNSTTGTIGLFSSGTGTAAAPAIVPTGDTNTGIFFPAADTIAFSEGGAEAVRINSSGQVGIGTSSPSARLTAKAIGNAYANSAALSLVGTDNQTSYITSAGGSLFVSNDGSTDQLVLSSSGNLGVGTASPAAKLDVSADVRVGQGQITADTTVGNLGIYGGMASGTTNAQLRFFGKSVSNTGQTYEIARISGSSFSSAYSLSGGLQFSTALNDGANNLTITERLRIDSSGNLLVGTTDSATNAGVGLKFVADSTAPYMGYVSNTAINASNYHLYNTNATNNGFRFYVTANGGIYNYSANNVNLSDERLKTNINLAGNYLDKICSIPVKTFNYKDQGEDTEKTIGIIAQEVEAHIPELINNDGFGETPADGIPLKTIYQTDLQYVLMRCIQEQQAMIQELSAKVTALEAA